MLDLKNYHDHEDVYEAWTQLLEENFGMIRSARGQQKDIYHISDEFFKEVFKELLGGEQRGLVELLLPQVIVIMHRLQRDMKDKVSAQNTIQPWVERTNERKAAF